MTIGHNNKRPDYSVVAAIEKHQSSGDRQVTPETLINQALRIQRTAMNTIEVRSKNENLTEEDLEMVGLLVRGIASASKEYRQIQKDQATIASEMSYEERRTVMMEFFVNEMPVEHQQWFFDEAQKLVKIKKNEDVLDDWEDKAKKAAG